MRARRLALCVVALLAVAATAMIPAALAGRAKPGGGGGGGGTNVPRQCQRYPEGSAIRQRCIDHFGGGGGGAAATISALKLTPSTFKANPTASTPLTTDPTKGTAVTFNLTAASRVVFRVFVKIPNAGRKVRGKCVARTRANKNKPKCTLKRGAGRFPYDGVAGANAFRFNGHAGRALKPGKYSLEGTPTTNRSSTAKANFTVRR